MDRFASTGNLSALGQRSNVSNSVYGSKGSASSTGRIAASPPSRDITTATTATVNAGIEFGGIDNHRIKIGVRNWHAVAAPQEVVDFIVNTTGIMLQNMALEGPLLVGFVSTRYQADQLLNLNSIRFPKRSGPLKLEIMNSNNSKSTTSNTIEFLRNVVLKRYDPQNRFLNFDNLYDDQDLVQRGMLANVSTRSRMFPALLKIASEEDGLVVETLSLNNNKLKDIVPINNVPLYFPHLQNLSLLNNYISRTTVFDQWRSQKLINLRELILINNPVTKYHGYRNDMLQIFPKLSLLDNTIVRDQTQLNNIYSFPVHIKQFFFENNQIQTTATDFVTKFLQCWDTDRSQLTNLYTQQSQFSVTVDATQLPSTVKFSDQNPSFGYYILESRNMVKLSNFNSLNQRIAAGPQQIATLFNTLPRTKHHLIDDSLDYKIESVTLPNVNGFMIILHGYFEETGKPLQQEEKFSTNSNYGSNSTIISTSQRSRRYASSSNASSSMTRTKLSKKSFDRTWILIPMNNSIVIASEMMTIRSFSMGSWEDVINGNNKYINPTSINSGQFSIPSDMLSNLTPIQIDLVQKIHQFTNLNFKYTQMLLEQSSWDYDTAMTNFQNSMNSLPKDAFIVQDFIKPVV